MIIKNKVFSKILSKSGQFNFYKSNYNKLKKQNRKLKNKNNNLANDLRESYLINDNLQKKLGVFSKPKILNKLINGKYDELTIAIKSPSPKNSNTWGDYFFAIALKKSFEKKGFNVVIHEREDWYYNNDDVDINLVLRGVINFEPDYEKINLMWNISHPDMISINEFDKYDMVFIASDKYAKKISNLVSTPVKTLYQCTDPEVFFPEKSNSLSEDIIFVGVTRGVFREIVKDVLNTNHEVSIYGRGWENFIDKKHIKKNFIPNEELHKYYSSCKILLNDHWEDMKINDFPSNRLFDALACETFVISDKIDSANDLLEDCVITYDSQEDLNKKIEYYLNNDEQRVLKAKKGRKIVLKNHTFDNRVDFIINSLIKLEV